MNIVVYSHASGKPSAGFSRHRDPVRETGRGQVFLPDKTGSTASPLGRANGQNGHRRGSTDALATLPDPADRHRDVRVFRSRRESRSRRQRTIDSRHGCADGDFDFDAITVLIWYENEYGFSTQMLDLARYVASATESIGIDPSLAC